MRTLMSDNQKIALIATGMIIVFLVFFFRTQAEAMREHAKQIKQERKLDYECIRSGNCE